MILREDYILLTIEEYCRLRGYKKSTFYDNSRKNNLIFVKEKVNNRRKTFIKFKKEDIIFITNDNKLVL